MKRFEYRTEVVPVTILVEDALALFNKLGSEGWQVVQMLAGRSVESSRLWFMRELPE